MENGNEKVVIKGRDIVAELVGDLAGMGAGTLIGGVALGVIENIPGIGKPMKFLLKLGAYGLDIAALYIVREQTMNYVNDTFDTIDMVRGFFHPKKVAVENPVEEAKVVE